MAIMRPLHFMSIVVRYLLAPSDYRPPEHTRFVFVSVVDRDLRLSETAS